MRVLVVGSGGREHALAWKLAQSPGSQRSTLRPGTRHRAPRGVPSSAPRMRRACSRCATTLGVDLVVIGPEAPLVAGVADTLRHGGIAVFGPSARGRADRRLEDLREGGHGGRRRPDAGQARRARPPCVVKADGLAAGKGVFVCHTEAEVQAGTERGRRTRRRAGDRGAARGPGGLAVRAHATAATRCRLRRRRTSSGSATATRARTPAAWARTRPSLARRAAEVESSSRRSTGPCSRELARRGTPFRAALRRADADRRRAARARVQLPLRGSRDAIDPPAARGRPARGARRRPPEARSTRSSRSAPRRGRHGRARGRRLPRAQRRAGRRSRGSRTPRRRAGSSSMPGPRA